MKFVKFKTVDTTEIENGYQFIKIKKRKDYEYGDVEDVLGRHAHRHDNKDLICFYYGMLPLLLRSIIDEGRKKSEDGWITHVIIFSPNEKKRTFTEPKMAWYYSRKK
jgi:hypothetical protein